MAVVEALGEPGERAAWYSLAAAQAGRFADPNVVTSQARGPGAPAAAAAAPGDARVLVRARARPDHQVRGAGGVARQAAARPAATCSGTSGAGSGSVAIEAALLLTGGSPIVAVEKDPRRVEQINANARRFGVRQAGRRAGRAAGRPRRAAGPGPRLHRRRRPGPAAHPRPRPRACGRTGSWWSTRCCWRTCDAAAATLRQLGFRTETVQVQVTAAARCRSASGWRPLNPVWIVTGTEARRADEGKGPDRVTSEFRIRSGGRHPVLFVGAGPGDPELITVKGQRALAERADLVVYTGSLVPEALLALDAARPARQQRRPAPGRGDRAAMAHPRTARACGWCDCTPATPASTAPSSSRSPSCDRRAIPLRRRARGHRGFRRGGRARDRVHPAGDLADADPDARGRPHAGAGRREPRQALAAHRASMAIYLSVGPGDAMAETLGRAYGAGCALRRGRTGRASPMKKSSARG